MYMTGANLQTVIQSRAAMPQIGTELLWYEPKTETLASGPISQMARKTGGEILRALKGASIAGQATLIDAISNSHVTRVRILVYKSAEPTHLSVAVILPESQNLLRTFDWLRITNAALDIKLYRHLADGRFI